MAQRGDIADTTDAASILYDLVIKDDVSSLVAAVNYLKSSGEWDHLGDEELTKVVEDAYEREQEEMIYFLVSAGTHVTTKCLEIAVKSNNEALVKYTISVLKTEKRWYPTEKAILSILVDAYSRNDDAMIGLLTEEGVDVTSRCLVCAVGHDDMEFVKATIEKMQLSKTWNTEDKICQEALEMAYVKSQEEVVDILIAEGIDITPTILDFAVKRDDISIIQKTIHRPKRITNILAVWSSVNDILQRNRKISIEMKEALQSGLSKLRSYDDSGVSSATDSPCTGQSEYPSTPTQHKSKPSSSGTEGQVYGLLSEVQSKLGSPSSQTTRSSKAFLTKNESETSSFGSSPSTSSREYTKNAIMKDANNKSKAHSSFPLHTDGSEFGIQSDIENKHMATIYVMQSIASSDFDYVSNEDTDTKGTPSLAIKSTSTSSDSSCLGTPGDDEKAKTREVPTLQTEVVSSTPSTVVMEIKQLEQLFDKDPKPSKQWLTQSLNFYLDRHMLEESQIILKQLCSRIGEEEKENCIAVYPAYKEGKWKPVIILLEKSFGGLQRSTYEGIEMYRRRYDFVSQEASKVMNDKKVQNNLLGVEEANRVKQAIVSKDLAKEHSNITLVTSCPFRSRQGGKELVQETCIVIHCLLKGYIPFGEEPFPKAINGVPVDVREGYCVFGMNDHSPMDCSTGFVNHGAVASSNVQVPHPGERSTEYNEKLLLGTGIGPSGGDGRGTLGGFVKLEDRSIGFLTCAHVVPGGVATKVSQPADVDLMPENKNSYVCGEVIKHVFDPGCLDRCGVDAAVVKITDSSRLPQEGKFVHVRQDQTRFAGFKPGKPPTFSTGKSLKTSEITEDQKRMTLVKYGSETGLTVGILNQNGTYTRGIKFPDGREVEFFNQYEVLSVVSTSTRFFDLGDSGSLVFLPLSRGFHCVGLAIGVTNYHSCIVTPIENVLESLGIELFNFTNSNLVEV